MSAATLLICTAIATITVVVPVVAYLFGGAQVRGVLEPIRAWLVRYSKLVIAVVLGIIGAVMIGKGLAGFWTGSQLPGKGSPFRRRRHRPGPWRRRAGWSGSGL